ncbi:hypothetical protein EVAR_103641_1 [Eumeta japonica]|uniref:Uncharacterized protein n=1 Tax=Eumeta variegata TaxID=151549 RepID=A0A4C1ZV89_EUMVA|nr:hypothetical protein EVAR_103641_1 [Eumeta japonica]
MSFLRDLASGDAYLISSSSSMLMTEPFLTGLESKLKLLTIELSILKNYVVKLRCDQLDYSTKMGWLLLWLSNVGFHPASECFGGPPPSTRYSISF